MPFTSCLTLILRDYSMSGVPNVGVYYAPASANAKDALAATGEHHRISTLAVWRIFTPSHAPIPNLEGHLTFALKYEGLDLAVPSNGGSILRTPRVEL
jgi:hypothetical protein